MNVVDAVHAPNVKQSQESLRGPGLSQVMFLR
jgi:hypothetical protein